MRLSLIWVGASLLAGYIGAERCKLCHRAVFESWQRTSHSSTAAVGVDAEERCLSCHTSGGAAQSGVQCEACHGGGEDYWPAEVMIDPEKASMAGLIRPTEATCRRCHGSDEPDHAREFVMPPEAEWTIWIHSRKP